VLRVDCIVIAGTGSGKTMPFGMPLLSCPRIADAMIRDELRDIPANCPQEQWKV
jgi:superfamily II DNA/RNA helicase